MKRSIKGLAALAAVVLFPAGLMAQSVTVHSDGTTGDYATIGAALAAVQADASGPDVITVLDEGPFIEGTGDSGNVWQITGDSNNNPLTIEAASGVRPIVVLDSTGWTAVLVTKHGDLTIRDLVFLPRVGGTHLQVPHRAFQIDGASSTGYDILFENVVFTSNDGSNQPVASLDGLTPPAIDPQDMGDARSFRGVAIEVTSTKFDANEVYRLNIRDTVISGNVFGATASGGYGIRGFMNGNPGSEWVIGEGCVVSYNTNISTSGARAAVQPGGNEGAIDIFRIEGTEANPVKIINNVGMHGVEITASNIADSEKDFKWVVIANNSERGITTNDSDEILTFENVTVVNNGLEAIALPGSYTAAHTAVDTILAGNGEAAEMTNVPAISSDSTGTFTFTNSAIVLEGPYAFMAGVGENIPANVTLVDVVTTDPEFPSVSSADAEFIDVTNEDYADAGPGGAPLRGAGSYTGPAASVQDWTLMQ